MVEAVVGSPGALSDLYPGLQPATFTGLIYMTIFNKSFLSLVHDIYQTAMGIAGFMIWFVKNFGASVSTLDVKRSNNPPNAQTPPAQPPPRQQPHITCDYLYLDLNGFVHNRARQARYFVAHSGPPFFLSNVTQDPMSQSQSDS